MNRIEVTEKIFKLPEFDYDVLVVEQGKSRSSSQKGQVKEVKVTPAGVTLHFLSGGGKPMQGSMVVVYREPPKSQEPPPPPVTKAPDIVLLPKGEAPPQPKLVELVTPPPMPMPKPKPKPQGESLDVSEQADATVEPKE